MDHLSDFMQLTYVTSARTCTRSCYGRFMQPGPGLVVDTEQYIWDYPIRVGVGYDLLFVKQKAHELVHMQILELESKMTFVKNFVKKHSGETMLIFSDTYVNVTSFINKAYFTSNFHNS